MKTYRLATHAFLRVLDGHAFILDLLRDEYLAFKNSAALARQVDGWPSSMQGSELPDVDQPIRAEHLLTEGLLREGEEGKSAEPVQLDLPTTDWSDEWLATDLNVGVADIWRFLAAYLQTLTWWRRPMRERVELLRKRVAHARPVYPEEYADEVRRLTGVFLRLRPWFYTALEECLFDSFVMVNFLSRYGCAPYLVIGVAGRPFGAHSWVQFLTHALNELDAKARRHRAIMVV
jgi:hypothetical protein